jgi:hypothetical protein
MCTSEILEESIYSDSLLLLFDLVGMELGLTASLQFPSSWNPFPNENDTSFNAVEFFTVFSLTLLDLGSFAFESRPGQREEGIGVVQGVEKSSAPPKVSS